MAQQSCFFRSITTAAVPIIKIGTIRRKKLHHLTVPIHGRSYQSRKTRAQSEASSTTTYFVCSLLVDACQKQRLHHLAVPIPGRNYKSRKTILQQNETTNQHK